MTGKLVEEMCDLGCVLTDAEKKSMLKRKLHHQICKNRQARWKQARNAAKAIISAEVEGAVPHPDDDEIAEGQAEGVRGPYGKLNDKVKRAAVKAWQANEAKDKKPNDFTGDDDVLIAGSGSSMKSLMKKRN